MNIKLDKLFIIFFAAIMLDFFTGVIAAAKEGRLKSRTCSNGLFRSIGECIVLATFFGINHFIPEIDFMIRTFCFGFVFKEGLSIVENLIRLGVWIPESLKKMLQVGVDKVENINLLKK